jgi:vacuolar iron transporter family protein
MDTLYHREEHFEGGDTVKDIVIGMSDGLTVPFALAAGISGAISAAHIVVTAGFAEIAAGSIAMGLGGYLAARSETEHYHTELAREEAEILEKPEVEAEEVATVFREYGLTEAEYGPVVAGLRTRPKAWRDFMMRFELGLEEPDPKRAFRSAITIALSYVAGGIVPLAPYILFHNIQTAFYLSVAFTLAALAVFGAVKGKFTGVPVAQSALQTVLVGGLAAAFAYGLARMIS